MPEKKKLKLCIVGAICGAINGLFGSGGGLIAIPSLKACGYDVKRAHASSIAMTASFSIVTVCIYLFHQAQGLSLAIRFIPTGIVGALVGTILLKRVSPVFLSRIFALIMIYSGVRLIL